MMRNPEQTIGNIADKQSTMFVGSVDDEGFPNIKAMLGARRREGIRVFYFSTNTSSLRVGQYRKNPQACVYFCDKRFFRGAMLLGKMEVLTDAASKQLIWCDGDERFYPLGVDDPDYCVLRFTAVSGRCFSNGKSEEFKIMRFSE